MQEQRGKAGERTRFPDSDMGLQQEVPGKAALRVAFYVPFLEAIPQPARITRLLDEWVLTQIPAGIENRFLVSVLICNLQTVRMCVSIGILIAFFLNSPLPNPLYFLPGNSAKSLALPISPRNSTSPFDVQDALCIFCGKCIPRLA